MTGPRRSTLILATSLAAVLALALSGCFPAAGPQPVPTVKVDTPRVPASLTQSEPIISLGGQILPATGKAPFAIGGSQQLPGTSPAPVVWTSTDGSSWAPHPVDRGVGGAFGGSLQGDASLSAVSGTIWKDGAISTAIWTSTDRITWKRQSLPEGFASHFRATTMSVAHGRVALIGANTEGVLRGALITGGKASDVKLPQPAKGKVLDPYSLTWGDNNDLLLLAESKTEGGTAPVSAYFSTNAGSTWSKPTVVAQESDFVSGTAWTGAAWVVTGGKYASTDPGAPYRPAAWSSPDGTTWTAESVPEPSSNDTFFRGTDAWLATPDAGPDGDVAALGPNDSAVLTAVYHRTADGAWQYVTDTSVNDGNGVSGIAVPLADGRIMAAVGTEGGVRVGIASGGWSDGTRLSTLAPSNQVTAAQTTPTGVQLTLRRNTFTVGDHLSWNNSSVASLASISKAGKITDAPWDPADVARLTNVIGSTAGTAQVILGSDYSSGKVNLVNGWFRATPADPWTKATGFSTTGATEFAAVKKIGAQWIAVGTVRTDSDVATPLHSTVWTSPDGVSWTAASGDFGSGPLETSAVDICTAGKTPIAVGWTETTTGKYALTAWEPTGGSWKKIDLGTFDDTPGYGTGCTDGPDGVIVAAYLGGRSVLLLNDKQGWKRVFRAERGDSLSTPVAVPGGYAAAGAFSDSTHSEAVVWLSSDAKNWAPVAVPSLQDGETSQVAVLGKDLIVTMSPSTGPAVSIVRDVKAAIKQYAH